MSNQLKMFDFQDYLIEKGFEKVYNNEYDKGIHSIIFTDDSHMIFIEDKSLMHDKDMKQEKLPIPSTMKQAEYFFAIFVDKNYN